MSLKLTIGELLWILLSDNNIMFVWITINAYVLIHKQTVLKNGRLLFVLFHSWQPLPRFYVIAMRSLVMFHNLDLKYFIFFPKLLFSILIHLLSSNLTFSLTTETVWEYLAI